MLGRARAQAKQALFDHFPAMPVAERVDSVLRARATSAIQRGEDLEVSRARELLGAPIVARVVTVITTYKRPQLLRQAVDSALAQNIDDHAVVVVDDAGEQVPDFDDPRVHVVSLTKNIGICGVVRNVGIRVSDSELVAFLDDDNAWRPDHLDKAITAIAPDVLMAYTGVRIVNPAGEVVRELRSEFDRKRLRHTNYIDTSSIVVRRTEQTWFSRLPRARHAFRHEDWELVYRLSARGRVVGIPDITVEYLDNPESYYH